MTSKNVKKCQNNHFNFQNFHFQTKIKLKANIGEWQFFAEKLKIFKSIKLNRSQLCTMLHFLLTQSFIPKICNNMDQILGACQNYIKLYNYIIFSALF